MRRFELPGAENRGEAELLYADVRQRMRRVYGLSVSHRRIAGLEVTQATEVVAIQVGEPSPLLGGDIALCIFEVPDEQAYVLCGPRHGVATGQPVRVDYDAVTAVEEFGRYPGHLGGTMTAGGAA